MKNGYIYITIFFAVMFFAGIFLDAPIGAAYELTVQIPGVEQKIEGPAQYVAAVYQFGLMIVGLVALGVIVFAGIEYTVSAGNTSRQEDAMDRIKQAIFGILLLVGAYFILYTIDPNIVNLKNPSLPALPTFEGGGSGGGSGSDAAYEAAKEQASKEASEYKPGHLE